MLFSIVIPVYNVEKYLKECVDSILNQNFYDYEVILVDDGSTDNSGNICDEYSKIYTNIKTIHKKNEGLLLARRTGIAASRGEYCLHCDSDDYVATGMLSQINTIIQNSNPDMVMYGYDVVDDDRNVLEQHYDIFSDQQSFNKQNRNELILKLSTTTWLNNMWSKATKRSCIDINDDYKEYKSIKMGEDLLQVSELVKRCDSFVFIAKPLYHYRKNVNGMSKAIQPDYLKQYVSVAHKLYSLLRQDDYPNTYLVKYHNRFLLDIVKYLLMFSKNGMRRDEYEGYFKMINEDSIYRIIISNPKDINIINKLLLMVTKPQLYKIANFLTRTILNKKI